MGGGGRKLGADGGERDLNSIKISTNLPKLVLMILYPIQPKIILTDTRESQCCDDESFPFLLRLIHLRIRSATLPLSKRSGFESRRFQNIF